MKEKKKIIKTQLYPAIKFEIVKEAAMSKAK